MRTIAQPTVKRTPASRAGSGLSTKLRGGSLRSFVTAGPSVNDDVFSSSRVALYDQGAVQVADRPEDSVGHRCRVSAAGAELAMVVLVNSIDGCVGIDLDSGAFVRAIHPPLVPGLKVLDVVTATLAGTLDPPDESRPEAVDLVSAPRRVGRLTRRRAAHYFDALNHPTQGPLLGFSGPSAPYWTLTGDKPSLTLITPEVGPQIRRTEAGFQCRFAWQSVVHELPMGDMRLCSAMRRHERASSAGRDLAQMIGFRPQRLLIMLASPSDGYCHKQVAALLPG